MYLTAQFYDIILKKENYMCEKTINVYGFMGLCDISQMQKWQCNVLKIAAGKTEESILIASASAQPAFRISKVTNLATGIYTDI